MREKEVENKLRSELGSAHAQLQASQERESQLQAQVASLSAPSSASLDSPAPVPPSQAAGAFAQEVVVAELREKLANAEARAAGATEDQLERTGPHPSRLPLVRDPVVRAVACGAKKLERHDTTRNDMDKQRASGRTVPQKTHDECAASVLVSATGLPSDSPRANLLWPVSAREHRDADLHPLSGPIQPLTLIHGRYQPPFATQTNRSAHFLSTDTAESLE